MQSVTDSRFKEFVEENFPHPYNSMERWEEYIYDRIGSSHSSALGLVMPAVRRIIDSLNKEYARKERRLFADIVEGKDKLPRRIVEKIINQPEKYTIENFNREIEDIVRFRIVCNYISDVFKVAAILKTDSDFKNCCQILDEKDYIFENRNKPHRAIHFILEVTMRDMSRKVELQIMTLLQEAWDKKDHNLIYEKERIGKEIDRKDKIKMQSMSDLLYVADEFFDSLRTKIVKSEEENEQKLK